MSVISAIRAQIGLSVAAANNFTFDASAVDGTMKLARGDAGAPTQDIMVVNADGTVEFPQNPVSNYSAQLLNPITATNQTAITFNTIPSWTKKVTVLFDALSTNGSSDILVRVGVSGSAETSGYLSTAVLAVNGANGDGATSTVGFIVMNNAAVYRISGQMQIIEADPTNRTWVAGGNMGTSSTSAAGSVVGSKSLTAVGTVGIVTITTAAGTQTFDAGSVAIFCEGGW